MLQVFQKVPEEALLSLVHPSTTEPQSFQIHQILDPLLSEELTWARDGEDNYWGVRNTSKVKAAWEISLIRNQKECLGAT